MCLRQMLISILSEDGRKYLYDFLAIKKETSSLESYSEGISGKRKEHFELHLYYNAEYDTGTVYEMTEEECQSSCSYETVLDVIKKD